MTHYETRERLALPEALQEEPRGYIRIHHFLHDALGYKPWDGGSLWEALRGESEGWVNYLLDLDTATIMRARAEHRQNAVSQPQEITYDDDRFGDLDAAGVKAQLAATAADYRRISRLPDEAVLKIGVTKDVTCGACAMGAHCVAHSMLKYSKQRNRPAEEYRTVKREGDALEWIVDHMNTHVPDAPADEWYVGDEPIQLVGEDGQIVEQDAPYMLMTMRVARLLFDAPRMFII